MAKMLLPLTAAAGAAGMYLLDPAQGPRRRALLRDQAVRRYGEACRFADVASRDLRHRARGTVAAFRSLTDRTPVSDAQLVARVRARLGRYTSHPRAVEVAVEDERLVLRGAILAPERQRLVRAVRAVPGAQRVEDQLSAYESPQGISELQGAGPAEGERPAFLQRQWPPAMHLLCIAGAVAAAALMVRGLTVRGGPG
jgi:hypothetical protein